MENIWVTKAEYKKDFELRLEFSNGAKGTVNLKNNLDKPIFEPLKNKDYFKTFKLNSWTIEWENGADFAPEFLFHKIEKE